MREATQRAESVALEVKNEAEGDAVKIREEALADSAIERERLLGDLRGQVAALAMAAAQKLIGEALDEKRQRTLINEFFSGVKAGKVVVLEDCRSARRFGGDRQRAATDRRRKRVGAAGDRRQGRRANGSFPGRP